MSKIILNFISWLILIISLKLQKNKYNEFNIPFEKTELEAAERYKKEYEKFKDYFEKHDFDMQSNKFIKNIRNRKINYSYNPSVKFLNSIENPIVATLAALGPREIWNKVFFEEYVKAYGLWALVVLNEEKINQISNKMYDEKMKKVLKLYSE